MKLSLAECQSQYHQLNKARLKLEMKPVNAVLQMQPISEKNCLKGTVLLLVEQLTDWTMILGEKKSQDTRFTVQNIENLHPVTVWVKKKHENNKKNGLFTIQFKYLKTVQ